MTRSKHRRKSLLTNDDLKSFPLPPDLKWLQWGGSILLSNWGFTGHVNHETIAVLVNRDFPLNDAHHRIDFPAWIRRRAALRMVSTAVDEMLMSGGSSILGTAIEGLKRLVE